MNGLEQWVLGYLLNSLWQVPMVFAAAWMVSRIVTRVGPRVEHRVWVSALVLEAILPACGWRANGLGRSIWSLLHGGSRTGLGLVQVSMEPGMISRSGALRLPAAVLAGIEIAYGGVLVYFAARLAWGLWRTDAMRRKATPINLIGDAGLRWDRFRKAFDVETASAAKSDMTAGPVTVGMWHGIMLVPPGFLESVPADDLDAVLAHECAHMRRRDFAKNAAYGFVTLTVAYHPVVWLTRARVAATREMVCDAMAAEAVAGRERYARSLLRLASLLAKGGPARTLHAIGIFDANIFERRVMKLTEKRVEMKGVRRMVVAVACVVLGVATCASAMALRITAVAAIGDAGGDTSSIPQKVGGIVSAPLLISSVRPEYTEEARKAKASGKVLLNFWVGTNGKPSHIRVIRGLGMGLDAAAMNAVSQYRFKPAMENGKPVLVEQKVEVNFQIF